MKEISEDQRNLHVQHLIDHYQLSILPLEGTFFKNTYTAATKLKGLPTATAMIGLYAHEPLSQSNFHKLDHDEIWHFYHGDPFILYLLGESGVVSEIKMGSDVLSRQHVQYLVPAETWQGACLLPTSSYALFGCTMAPGFTSGCFEAAERDQLISEYPKHQDIITKLTTTEFSTRLSPDFDI